MKTLFRALLITLVLSIFPINVSATVPMLINYQGQITNAQQGPLNGSFDMVFRIYSSDTTPTPLWTETHNAVSIDQGVFNVFIGSFTSLDGLFTAGQDRWLEVQIDTDPPMTPRYRIVSGAYSIHSDTADSVPWSGITGIPANMGIPAGAIIMWSGDIVDIPQGWQLCDGTNGTPNLTDRFILSVGPNEETGATGGQDSHQHSVPSGAVENHYHLSATGVSNSHFVRSKPWGSEYVGSSSEVFIWFDGTYDNGGGNYYAYKTSPAKSSGENSNTASSSYVPKHYKLAFIMKL